MHVDGILVSLQQLNSARVITAKPKRKLAVAPPLPRPNGHVVLDPEETLRIHAARIVAAFGLDEKGVTVDAVVAGVRNFEQPYVGVTQ